VLGGGSWGTALAAHLTNAGHDVCLWLRDPATAREIVESRENRRYLAGFRLPAGLQAGTELARTVADRETVFVVIPSEFCRGVYRELRSLVSERSILVSATKGIEVTNLRRMSEVAGEEIPGRPVAVLSGPSFALEVLQGQPTAVVVAAAELGVAETVQRVLSSRTFRAYSSDDVIGVEMAGALKNVIAIAAGIIDGLGYGHNTLAALITRGLAEMTRLAVAMGGRSDTLSGLAGLGDLVLTGAGNTLDQALASTPMVAEGVRTTLATCALAERLGVEMPIATEMREVLYRGKPPRTALEELMLRSLKRE
jgi:glycerol-3-phosphate dehydrogenase (NAD(P)+)